jgi:hypothetical protein
MEVYKHETREVIKRFFSHKLANNELVMKEINLPAELLRRAASPRTHGRQIKA